MGFAFGIIHCIASSGALAWGRGFGILPEGYTTVCCEGCD